MIFIPLGISNKDRNKYELTQYINDVTTQNTQVLMEYSNESGITAYSYGNERLSYEVNGETYRYNYDGRGSVTNLLDNNNTSVVQYNYKPFGETTKSGIKADELENTYQYNAESTDAITGLQYLRARYYDSEAGRFTSKDTYLGDITDPLTRNLYLYTNNDPVNYVDPSRHFLSKLIGYVNATVQSVKDIGQGIVNFVKNPSYDNFVNQVKNTTSKIISNYSSVNETEKKRKDERTYEEKELDRILKVKQGPVLNTQNTNQKGAATNQKAEQSKLYEYQIKELRKLNTKKANEIADKLEEIV